MDKIAVMLGKDMSAKQYFELYLYLIYVEAIDLKRCKSNPILAKFDDLIKASGLTVEEILELM